ncbi:hypothetical protein [Pedomonas sp. V897]|uniref:hypothetical protein n=1 Tax=Pedomonas sp. V897 TaxID=3446482 RepID=UPI003EE35B3E
MLPCALDFRICSDSVRAARASFAALSQAVAVAPLSDDLAERLQALAPGAQAAAGLLRFSYEAFRHGGVTIIEARLAPGDPYLDFVAALAARAGMSTRFSHGWPILLQNPLAARAAGGAAGASAAALTPVQQDEVRGIVADAIRACVGQDYADYWLTGSVPRQRLKADAEVAEACRAGANSSQQPLSTSAPTAVGAERR